MERPQIVNKTESRNVTGEIVYYDQMREAGQYPDSYEDLSDMAIQMYEVAADLHIAQGVRPAIMDEYERFDGQLGSTEASCVALADELLKLKDDNGLTFVDIAVEQSPDMVVENLRHLRVGEVLHSDDEQLAFASDGSHYPILDIKKRDSQLTGVGVRIWGWDDEKYIFTNNQEEEFNSDRHVLRFPSNEVLSRRQIEVGFSYQAADGHHFNESVSLWVDSMGSARMSSSVWVAAYAETGYEGHGGRSLGHLKDEDIAAFGDLVAEIVGDEPESIGMRQDRFLQEIIDSASTPEVKEAIEQLIHETWPAQALYFLTRRFDGTEKTISRLTGDTACSKEAVDAIRATLTGWKNR